MIRPATRTRGDATPEAEAELMRRVGLKDREAFRRFYDLYSPRIGGFLLRMLGRRELADEGVNDVMLAVWQGAPGFDAGQGKLSTWLFGIAHNKGLKLLERERRRQAEQPLELDPPEALEDGPDEAGPAEKAGPANPERTVLGWELGEILEASLQRLPDEHRIALELAFGEGRSYQEIAEITGCPANTVKTRVFHARKKLHEMLERRGWSPAALAQEG